MGDSTSRSGRRRAPVAAVCVALVVCLVITGGIVVLVERMSNAIGSWEPPTAAEPQDTTIETPPHDELTGPPTRSEIPADDGGEPAQAGADEQHTPVAVRHPSDSWLDEVSESTGVSRRALLGYANAELILAAQQPACGLSWSTLAGIGFVETGHGTYAGGEIGPDGTTTVNVVGIPLDGSNNTRAIPDTDGGVLDGDDQWDRAIGPMQFIPGTWAEWGETQDGEAAADPHNIDDAALTAGRYLCAEGRDLTVAPDWEAAIMTYNNSSHYVADVLAYAHAYADAA